MSESGWDGKKVERWAKHNLITMKIHKSHTDSLKMPLENLSNIVENAASVLLKNSEKQPTEYNRCAPNILLFLNFALSTPNERVTQSKETGQVRERDERKLEHTHTRGKKKEKKWKNPSQNNNIHGYCKQYCNIEKHCGYMSTNAYQIRWMHCNSFNFVTFSQYWPFFLSLLRHSLSPVSFSMRLSPRSENKLKQRIVCIW